MEIDTVLKFCSNLCFEIKAASWVRIVNGIDKYVTESMETKEEEEHRASGRLVAKARPRLKPSVTPSVSLPIRDRTWKEIETQRSHDQQCKKVSPAMTRLLRHDQTDPREDDGAVLFDDVLEECRKKKFDGASQLAHDDWISILAKGGAKKRFQDCLNPNSSRHFLYFRAIKGHSGDNAIDLELQDNVLLPEGFVEYVCHVGNASEINSTNRSGLIPGGRSLKRGRQSVFCTFTNPMEDDNTKKNLEPKYGILVQFKARSEERIAILTNTVTCNRSLQHTARRLH